MLGERGFELGDVVVVEHHGVLGKIVRHAARTRIAESEHARTGLHQQAVGMAVITALELDQHVAPGVTARQANGTHRRLGAGADQTHHVERRQQVAQQISHLDLKFGRRAEREAFCRRDLNGVHHVRMRMPKNQRSP